MTKSKKRIKPNTNAQALYFAVIVLVIAFGLVWIWRQLPSQNPPAQNQPTSPPSILATSTAPLGQMDQAKCAQASGKWVDCGSPCHGKGQDTVCIQVCEPQCLCGGLAGWQCPSDFTCTDWDPAPQVPDAIGVCRVKSAEADHAMPPVAGDVRTVPPGMVCGDGNAICVSKTFANALLANPISVTGTAIVFENQFSWKIADAGGNFIEQGNVMANAPDAGQPGDFQIRAFFSSLPHTAAGTLVLFDNSAKDGSVIDELRLPVKLPTLVQKTKIFLPTKGAAAAGDCSKVEAVEVPIVTTKLPVEASLRRLLAPLPATETRGLESAIPAGTELISIVVGQGTAKAVFSQALESGGSCRVTAIRAQIEQTLKQFASVKNVIISTEGRSPEESLQP